MLIRESNYNECLPLLQILWPDFETILSIDNTLCRIKYSGREMAKIKPRYIIALDDNGTKFGTTHAYESGPNELRIRGTYCDPSYRNLGIGKRMINQVIDLFPHCNFIYTFPRLGSEKFYASIGFTISDYCFTEIYKGIFDAYKFR